jgi:SAM-dependent methyltransferase
MASQGSAWYVDFFRSDYLNVYGHVFTEERAEKESTFVASALALKPGASVLDLCCGQGRHSIQLAKRGLHVTALDLNAEYLELAKQAAIAGKVRIETAAADMREIPFEDKFDAIVNMYSSFGYLESEAEDLKALESAAKALKTGGRILLDMLNREWAIDNYIQNDWHTGADGTLYVERRDLDLATSRMHVHFIVVDPKGGRRESIGHIIRLYTLTEMTRLLERVGVRVTAVFGGFEGEAYTIGTRRMIIVARKGSNAGLRAPHPRQG